MTELPGGLVLDARRVLWLPAHGTLVAADLHLGYAWAHRHAGNLLPVSAPEDAPARLGALAREYDSRKVVLLGDIVHRAARIEPLKNTMRDLARELEGRDIRWIIGNHDAGLARLLRDCCIPARLEPEALLGPHRLVHGAEDAPAPSAGGWLIMGHEHPAIHLGDGVSTRLKCPCFLASEDVLILPAFSAWAAGCDVRSNRMMSPLANRTRFNEAHAIMGTRLLRVPLG